MNIANDPTAVAVLAGLKSVGYSAADINTYLTNPTAPPVIIPPPAAVATFGLNAEGVDYPSGDPAVHPEIVPLMKEFGMGYMRLWMTGPLSGAVPDAKWNIARRYFARSINVIVVLNFQNSAVPTKAPAMTDWQTYLRSIPTADQTGVWAFEIGNELDFATYYSDTPANYVLLLQAAYTILKAKGYQVICGNVLYNTLYYQASQFKLAFASCDYIGGHFYDADAATALAAYDKLLAFAATVGKPVFCTEVGLHCNKNNPAAWAAQLTTLYAGLKSRAAAFLYFMLYTNTSAAGPESLLNASTYQPNQPFYAALEAAIVSN